MPYLCRLPSGRTITIVFYHEGLTHDIAFGKLLENGDRFRDALVGAVKTRSEDRLLVVATDGETHGHHHKFGEMALARLFERLDADPDVRLPDIGTFLEEHPQNLSASSKKIVHGPACTALNAGAVTAAAAQAEDPAGTRHGGNL